MNTPALLTVAEITAEVRRCFAVAGALASHTPGLAVVGYRDTLTVTVSLGLRGYRVMGRCAKHGRGIVLSFSAALWPAMTPEERLDTVRHEAAHAIDFAARGRSGHDAAWRSVAVLVGASPAATCALSDSARKVAREKRAARLGAVPVYGCTCGACAVTTRRVVQAIARGVRVSCRTCKAALRLEASVDVAALEAVVAAKLARSGLGLAPEGRAELLALAPSLKPGAALVARVIVVSLGMPEIPAWRLGSDLTFEVPAAK